ncbi:PAS domain-containing hybrid sensor histidine kinase/response regulator [Massilia sp. Leaf139]|uniref:hybrid sensor histidine kinase/response regulator n=1 Tax=Massilia sp. Leaf139 TaxID=1736272 RepID=UPI00138EDBA5|nr:PAS domain-containing hybrid sensor histidine kinase/response regulator [Massilia sp. Leaf139]
MRQTTRDLVALTALSAGWADLPAQDIIASLAAVLSKTLALDFAAIEIHGAADGSVLAALRSTPSGSEALFLPLARRVRDAAATAAGLGEAATLAHPLSGEALRVSLVPFGIGSELGTLVAGSRRPDFPTQNEHLLLTVGANQATTVLQRHFAKQALERSDLRFMEVANAAPAMLWVTEADGSCSFLSRGWHEFTGQDDSEGLGFGWIAAIHPDDREAARQAFLEANDRKSAFSLEHRLLHADGCYRWVIDAGRPRHGATGQFLGFVGNVLDISDRKQAEQALDQTRIMLSAVFEALPVGVAVVDRTGKVILSNHEMHQYLPTNVLPSLDEARQVRWQSFHTDGSRVALSDFAGARALRGERVVPGMEALYQRDDGSDLWTQVAAVPLHDSDGTPAGQVTVVMNIDAFKRTEAALRLAETKQRALFDEVARSNKNLSEFLAVLAHELRNPLAPILTGLEIIRLRSGHTDTVMNVRGMIERQVKQLSHLIDDLLDIARVTNGKVEIRKEAVDLKSIVSNAVETSLPLIEKGQHELTLRLDDASLPVLADPARIAQVIGNLLTNAAKYTPQGGRITLTMAREGDQARISVTDSGIGIPADALDSVFDMFSQVGRNMQHSQGGLGIGLSLVRQLVGLHEGKVEALSDGVGKGSSFVVRLPLDLANPSPRAAVASPGSITPAGKRLRILVADDNADAALTLSSLLSMSGHELRVAHDGQTALALAEQFRPHAAFLDIGMPGLTGYDVARRIRDNPALDGCILAAVSGWGTSEDQQRSQEAGFDRHFTKPVAPAHVMAFLDLLVLD